MTFLSQLFDSDAYLPHGTCILWQPSLLALFVGSDVLTGIAYYSIPFGLVYFASRRKDLEFRWMFVLFSIFILACGSTHFLDVWTLWYPDYGVLGLTKAGTAVMSIGTAVMVWLIMPNLLAIPSKSQLAMANHELAVQIGERREAESAVRQLNTDLERRVRERTAELERLNAELQAEIVVRRRMEVALRASELKARRLVDSNILGIVFWTPEGRITEANDALLSLVGRNHADLVAGRLRWEELTPPDAAAADEAAMAEVAERGVCTPYEREILRADGARVPVLMGIATLGDQPAERVGFLLDLSARKELEAGLQQAQKMETIGQLTGGVAHDFNNLLTVVIGNLELLSDRLGLDQAGLLQYARQASSAAERGAELTRRLLAFARRQPLEPKITDINRLVSGMSGLLERTLGETIEVRAVLGAGLWPTLVDPGQVENALLNLAINARDAMPNGGKLIVETANMRLDEDYEDRPADVPPGHYVMLAVSDSGSGMSAEVLARAVEPFFTTKALGKGSGLGLSMIYGFVRQSEGHMRIYSEVGHGTVVKLYFPRSKGVAETHAQEAQEEPASGEGQTVLVVEDDTAVRILVVGLLTDLGYRVHEATNGFDALDIIGSSPIDLLFTDVVLPEGMNGRELASAAQKLKPGLKILFTSGYTENGIVHHGRLDEGVQLLAKPYKKRDLARKLRALFGERQLR